MHPQFDISDVNTIEPFSELRRRVIKMSNDGEDALVTDLIARLTDITQSVRQKSGEVVASGDHIRAIQFFNWIRGVNARIKEAREELSSIEDYMSRTAVPDIMKAAGVKTVTVEGVGRVTVSYRYSCSMTDKELGIKWLKDHDYGSLVQETVNSSTLAAFSKSLLEDEGKELPVELFNVGTQPYTSITKK